MLFSSVEILNEKIYKNNEFFCVCPDSPLPIQTGFLGILRTEGDGGWGGGGLTCYATPPHLLNYKATAMKLDSYLYSCPKINSLT